MFNKPKIKTEENKAQSAVELAIFGAILVFVLGLLIKYAISFNFSQELPMRAFRQAFLLSSATGSPRINASVIIIEDRDLPDASSPLGTGQRTTYSAQASVSANNVLFRTLDYGNQDDLPYIDFYINSKHYSFTTADWRKYIVPVGQCVSGDRSACFRTKITEGHEWFPGQCIGASGSPYWCWAYISPYVVSPGGEYQTADVDNDDKEEFVVGFDYSNSVTNCHDRTTDPQCDYLCKRGTPECCNQYCDSKKGLHWSSKDRCMQDCQGDAASYDLCNPDYNACMTKCIDQTCLSPFIDKAQVMDYQEGDLDLTIDSHDIKMGKTTQGLRVDQKMAYLLEPGSSHFRREDINNIINTTVIKRKDTIERIIQTNRLNSGKYCSDNLKSQVKRYADAEIEDPSLKDYCDETNGELHVFSKFEVQQTRTWTTRH